MPTNTKNKKTKGLTVTVADQIEAKKASNDLDKFEHEAEVREKALEEGEKMLKIIDAEKQKKQPSIIDTITGKQKKKQSIIDTITGKGASK